MGEDTRRMETQPERTGSATEPTTNTALVEQRGALPARSPLLLLGAGGSDRGTPAGAVVASVLAAIGLAAWALSVRDLHPYTAGAFGLVTHLPLLWWLALIAVTAAVAVALIPRHPRTPVVVFAIIAFALVLHGTLPASESTPRFEAAYTIAGFANYIAQHGHTLPRIDARMSWYGMLAGDAMASKAMAVSPMWFLRWAPLLFELIYLFPVKALANSTLASPRARFAALPLFLVGNWIDQDYFSPQAIGLLLYLVVVLIAVRTLGARNLHPRPVRWLAGTRAFLYARRFALRRLALPLDAAAAELDDVAPRARTRTAVAVLSIFLTVVLVISHELSPVALCLVLFFLFLAGRTRLRTLWLFVAFAVFAWLSWEAEPFWSGHLTKLFGSVGTVTSTVTTSVGDRTLSTSLGRSVVEASRLGAAGLIWLLALAGVWVLWRRRRTQWTLIVLALAPIAVSGAVSYGGEVALRILLFSLAPLAVLGAALIDGPFLRRGAVVAFTLVGCALVLLFPFARYGNESFEAVAPGDIQATNWIYGNVPAGATILVFSRDEPLMYSHVGDYKVRELGAAVLDPVSTIESALPKASTWIFLSRTQQEYGQVYIGLKKGWMQTFERRLSQIPFVHLVDRTSTASVYQTTSRRHHHHSNHPAHKPHHPRPIGHAPKPKPPPVDHHLHQRTTPTTRPRTTTTTPPSSTTPTTHPPAPTSTTSTISPPSTTTAPTVTLPTTKP